MNILKSTECNKHKQTITIKTPFGDFLGWECGFSMFTYKITGKQISYTFFYEILLLLLLLL